MKGKPNRFGENLEHVMKTFEDEGVDFEVLDEVDMDFLRNDCKMKFGDVVKLLREFQLKKGQVLNYYLESLSKES